MVKEKVSTPSVKGAGKITAFFKTVPKAKEAATNCEESGTKIENQENCSRAANTSLEKSGNAVKNTQPSPSPTKRKRNESDETLSPEQKDRMSSNLTRAKIMRVSKTLPLVTPNIGPSWYLALQQEFDKPYFRQLNDFLEGERKGRTVFPSREEVWSWTTQTKIEETKVVILGQDPYHGVGQAHGLCFSVKEGIPPPPSLVNMYKELAEDIKGWQHPGHGYLGGWAEQGVLLLNACLTVRKAEANSHKDRGWERLTDAVIKYISDHCSGVVFLLWGAYAQKKAACVNSRKHVLLKSVHPSPLSAHRGFLGCKHFSKCNEALVKNGKSPIDWGKLPPMS